VRSNRYNSFAPQNVVSKGEVQISAATHPMNVQPRNRLKTPIDSLLRCFRLTAIEAGKKHTQMPMKRHSRIRSSLPPWSRLHPVDALVLSLEHLRTDHDWPADPRELPALLLCFELCAKRSREVDQQLLRRRVGGHAALSSSRGSGHSVGPSDSQRRA